MEIIQFPDKKGVSVNQLLEEMKNRNLHTVLILGVDKNDKMILCANDLPAMEVVFLLEKMKLYVLTSEMLPSDEEEDETA